MTIVTVMLSFPFFNEKKCYHNYFYIYLYKKDLGIFYSINRIELNGKKFRKCRKI